MKLVHQTQSGPNTLYVFEEEGKRILKINQLNETHSIYNPHDVLIEPLEAHYWNFITLLPYLTPMHNACILGLGAGTITRQLAIYHPALHIDGVECDKVIITLANDFFYISQPNLSIFHDDGLAFLRAGQTLYNLIVLDAFDNGNLAPAFLTEESFSIISNQLSPDGIFAANYIFSIPIHQSIKSLCARYFSHVLIVQIADSCNYVIIAGKQEIDISRLGSSSIPGRLKPLARYITNYAREVKSL